jgi:hypothetical protein
MALNESIPIACILPDDAYQARRGELQTAVCNHIQTSRELSDGYGFQFPGTDEWAAKLLEFITFERECCAFITFELLFEMEKGPIWLNLRGGDGVKTFVESELNMITQ